MNLPLSFKIREKLMNDGFVIESLPDSGDEDWLYVKESEDQLGFMIIIRSNNIIRFLKRIVYPKPNNFNSDFSIFSEAINEINSKSFLSKWSYNIDEKKINIYIDYTFEYYTLDALKINLTMFNHETKIFNKSIPIYYEAKI